MWTPSNEADLSICLHAQCIRYLRTWHRSMTSWTTPWVWESTACGRTCCCTSCTLSLGHDSWMLRAEQVKRFMCYNKPLINSYNPNNKPHAPPVLWPGDIAFRFLDYVRSQQERQQRRAARSLQTPSWQDISDNYPAEDGDVQQESRAVVCDINKEMLKVGKDKADSLGISAGLWFHLLTSDPCFCTQLGGFSEHVYMYTDEVFWDIPVHVAVRVKILWLGAWITVHPFVDKAWLFTWVALKEIGILKHVNILSRFLLSVCKTVCKTSNPCENQQEHASYNTRYPTLPCW